MWGTELRTMLFAEQSSCTELHKLWCPYWIWDQIHLLKLKKKTKTKPSGYIPIYLGMGMYVSSDLSSKQVEHEWRYLQTAANRPTRGIKDKHHGVREGIESGKGKSRV